MFSAKTLMSALALTGAAVAVTAPAMATAGTVVASTGPSASKHPVGKKYKDTDSITLRAGDSVTILDSKGTRVLRGPGTVVIGARGTSRASTFASLTRQRSGARARTGAVRSGSTGPSMTRPNLWYVDVSRGGNFCLTDTSNVRLWRPGMEGKSTYRIASPASTDHMHVTFDDGKMVTPLDTARMPIMAGQTYEVSGPSGAASVAITFTMLDSPSREPEGLASELIANGCTGQLELLSQTMMTS